MGLKRGTMWKALAQVKLILFSRINTHIIMCNNESLHAFLILL